MAHLSLVTRHFEEGIAEQRRALELDPLSLIFNTNLWRALFFARRYDDAFTQCKSTLDLDPSFRLHAAG